MFNKKYKLIFLVVTLLLYYVSLGTNVFAFYPDLSSYPQNFNLFLHNLHSKDSLPEEGSPNDEFVTNNNANEGTSGVMPNAIVPAVSKRVITGIYSVTKRTSSSGAHKCACHKNCQNCSKCKNFLRLSCKTS